MDRSSKTVDIDELAESLPKIIDAFGAGEVSAVDVVREGRVVAILHPPRQTLHGSLRGTVQIPKGFDLTAPAFEGGTHAEDGRLHE